MIRTGRGKRRAWPIFEPYSDKDQSPCPLHDSDSEFDLEFDLEIEIIDLALSMSFCTKESGRGIPGGLEDLIPDGELLFQASKLIRLEDDRGNFLAFRDLFRGRKGCYYVLEWGESSLSEVSIVVTLHKVTVEGLGVLQLCELLNKDPKTLKLSTVGVFVEK